MDQQYRTRLMLIAGIVLVVLAVFFCWCYAKKSARAEKWGWRVIGLLMVSFLAFTVWYYTPVSCHQTVQVYCEEAPFTPVEVALDLEVHRSYLYGKWLTGSARTPMADYPLDYSKKHVNGAFTRLGERELNLKVFRQDADMIDGSLGLRVRFSRGWKSVTAMEMWDYPLIGESTLYVTEGSEFLDYWRSK